MIPTPDMEAAPGRTDAWAGFHLDMQFKHRSLNTINNRKCNVLIMSKHATHDGITDPDQVTKIWLQTYLLRQGEDRKGNGYTSLYQDLRAFWSWWAEDAEQASPMAKIPQPATVTTSVPVLSQDQIDAILATCSGRGFDQARSRAITLLLMDSGLRRFELSALDVDDVDLQDRTITVLHGKGDKPRVSVVSGGPEASYDLTMRSPRMCAKPLTLALLAGSLAYSLAGCSNGAPATDGPLNGPFGTNGGHFICAPARVGQPRAFGFDTFTDHGHATVVLDRVTLLHPHNERLVGSFAVPGSYIVGEADWPPTPPVTPTWKDRQLVHGFRLAPGKTFNMVLGVVATASGRATAQGMRVYYYETTGGSYLTVDRNKIVIETAKQGC